MFNLFSYELTIIASFTYIIISSLIGLALTILSYLLTIRRYDAEKISAYECGFQPFGDAWETFDIWYYVVALSSVSSDLEVLFLLPWTLYVGFSYNGLSGVLSGYLFLTISSFGFIYEWRNGALEWE